MSNTCNKCENEDNCCLQGWVATILKDLIKDPTIDEARNFLEEFECRKSCINKELRNEINKLKKLIMSLSCNSPMYGEYDNINKCIILYLKNIYKHYPNNYGTILLNTFAHELFHAYHAICVEKNGKVWEDSSNDSIIVKESLASYFENHFASDFAPLRGCKYDKLDDEWAKYSIDAWPYAGAKHLTPYDKLSNPIIYPNHVLFRYVFMESLKSLSYACEMIRFGEKIEFEDF